jgi:hypothetical protein
LRTGETVRMRVTQQIGAIRTAHDEAASGEQPQWLRYAVLMDEIGRVLPRMSGHPPGAKPQRSHPNLVTVLRLQLAVLHQERGRLPAPDERQLSLWMGYS